MKKILTVLSLICLSLTGTFAEYNPDEEFDNKITKTKSITTTSIDYTDTSKKMHQSWDLNFDGINDCELNNTCDDSIDYTKAKTYPTSKKLLDAEGGICTSATDGCNNVMINDGKLGGMTMMYCEDVYGEKGKESWSCNAYDKEKINSLKKEDDSQNKNNKFDNLSKNDLNFYKTIKNRLDSKYINKVEKTINKYNKISNGLTFDKKEKLTNNLIKKVDDYLFKITMSVPQDTAMPKDLNNIYLTLNLLKLELKIQ